MSEPSPFPPQLRFAHPWRPYQARLLEELDPHLGDARLHVVAAPGAGKTVLGLEVVRRLGRRALVLAPTLTIRNQWVERFRSAFLSGGEPLPALIDHRLEAPAPIVVSTYQSLHAAAKAGGEAGAETGPAGIGTLVLDEAHHLRNEWWKVLVELVEASPGLTVVALTATPPLDVTVAEWNRYVTLCGPIDAEISVPELVAAGNLCPHQDYVHLSTPTTEEWDAISADRRAVSALRDELASSHELVRAVLGNPRFASFDDDAHREAVLGDPDLFSAMVVFLVAAGHECAEQRAFLGAAEAPVPDLDDRWLELLLADLLFANPALYDAEERFRRDLERRLRRAHAIEHRRVRLGGGQRHLRRLRASDAKVGSVQRIFDLERDALGAELRLVVLTDHVRREYLGAARAKERRVRLGAVPIFEALRADRSHDVPLCLLTGRLAILPRAAREPLAQSLAALGVEPPRVVPHPDDERYFLASIDERLRQGVVQAVTQLFEQGAVRAIVGTAALLAEGWDAQSANALVIASAVSTHVLSNQMRGRVIRIDPDNPAKASNIWHLACIEPGAPGGGADFETVRRRFAAFEGVSYDGSIIESGFSRLYVPPAAWTAEAVAGVNRETSARARERGLLADAWRRALDGSDALAGRGLVEELRCESGPLREVYVRYRPARSAAARSALALGAGTAAGLGLATLTGLAPGGMAGVAVTGGVAAALRLPRHLLRAYRAHREGWGAELVARVGECLLDAFAELARLETSREALRIESVEDRDGAVRASLNGGTRYESDALNLALEEVLSPVDNPRYLLAQRAVSPLGGGPEEASWYAVPAALGVQQAAEALARHWRRHLGRCELVYTRSAEGRLALLRARARSWRSAGRPERVNCWR